jgi:cell division protein FtsL
MENYNYLSTNNVDTTESQQIKICTKMLYSIPIVSSIIYSVYIILMFNQIVTMSNKINNITYLIDYLNTNETSSLITNLVTLEECILYKLQVC